MAGRAELAPQIGQEVEDVVEFDEDSPSGLMTASASEQSTTPQINCATDSEVCLPPRSLVHRVIVEVVRVVTRHGRGSPIAKGETTISTEATVEGFQRTSTIVGIRICLYVACRAVSVEGRCLFLCRLFLSIERIYEKKQYAEHLCTCDVHRSSFPLDAFWDQVR